MILIIIVLVLFAVSSPIQAQEFSIYQGSPVLKKGGNSAGVFQPFVLKKDNLFSAWFADSNGGKATIATMKSANGIDWYDKKTLQLSYRNHVHDPFMFINNDEYQLYFASSNDGPISLWKSVSNDGVTFTPGQEREILKPEQSWERFSVSCPSIIEDQSTQYLFYAGAGSTAWAVGMATSTDGLTWQKCENNPIIPEGSGPHIVKYNNVFYLFYQSPAGLQTQQTDSLNGCNTAWSNRHIISPPFGDPAPVVVGNNLWLYGTFGTPEGQAIGLAGNIPITQPTYPIVLIPGMFASWNSQALLHNNSVSYDEWKLNPNVSEYDAFIKTLENMGWKQNNNLYVFAYDWREPIIETTHNLDGFLTSKIWSGNPYQQVQIVGHSLGGVISRIYADQNPTKLIKQIVTAGSPHLGTVQAYKPLVAGEIDREDSLTWMAEKLILLLNKSNLQSDKDTVSQKLPVLFDLLPSFPFLKNESGTSVTSALTNTLISQYPINSSPTISQLYLGGSGHQTLGGYILGSRTPLDTLFGTYGDGHPVSSWREDGDGTILSKSSLNQISPASTQNHGEIIYAKESIKTILSNLNVPVQDSDIPIGKATTIYPAILTFIQSPATMRITHNDATTSENEGMIWIQNAENGEYKLNVTGTGEGEYTASVWLIGAHDDKWVQFRKRTASGNRDEYTISFDNDTGGTVSEYIAPTPTNTPFPTTTIIPSPTLTPTTSSISTGVSQSSLSNNNSTQNAHSESRKENTDSTKTNTNFTHEISDVIKRVVHTLEGKKSLVAKKIVTPQVLGVTNSKKIAHHSPLTILFFIKQILWSLYTIALLFFFEVKKLKKRLKVKIN